MTETYAGSDGNLHTPDASHVSFFSRVRTRLPSTNH